MHDVSLFDFSLNHSFYLWIALAIGLVVILMGAIIFLGWWERSKREIVPSPYTGHPLRPATHLSYASLGRIYRYMTSFQSYDNRMFSIKKAAYCRETGRIFTDCIDWKGKIKIDWTFLQKRFPGNYVSWGSLDASQQQMIRESHYSLSGFQTEISSSNPVPRLVEPIFANAIPGPLYVDIETKILLGWKNVPDTDLEVLIVQRPKI